jgi:hypothetical protein
VSVRGDLTDRLENLSSLAGGNHEQGCSCHLEDCPQGDSLKEGGFSNPPLSLGCGTGPAWSVPFSLSAWKVRIVWCGARSCGLYYKERGRIRPR